MAKVAIRDPVRYRQLANVGCAQLHPLFRLVPGDVETWERRPAPLAHGGIETEDAISATSGGTYEAAYGTRGSTGDFLP